MEWKPDNAKNPQPVALVGRVFMTPAASADPRQKSMDYMKCDMGGGAVAATLYAAAKNELPLHLVGLVPAADNRPDETLTFPVISLPCSTEPPWKSKYGRRGRTACRCADLCQRYNPQLVIDVALTGSAGIIAGSHGIVGMGNSSSHLEKLKQAGQQVYERIIEVPLWEEYARPLKSSVADLNNLGTREA